MIMMTIIVQNRDLIHFQHLKAFELITTLGLIEKIFSKMMMMVLLWIFLARTHTHTHKLIYPFIRNKLVSQTCWLCLLYWQVIDNDDNDTTTMIMMMEPSPTNTKLKIKKKKKNISIRQMQINIFRRPLVINVHREQDREKINLINWNTSMMMVWWIWSIRQTFYINKQHWPMRTQPFFPKKGRFTI